MKKLANENARTATTLTLLGDDALAAVAGGGKGRVAISDIQIVKYVDKASPLLAAHCATGAHFPEAKLFV